MLVKLLALVVSVIPTLGDITPALSLANVEAALSILNLAAELPLFAKT